MTLSMLGYLLFSVSFFPFSLAVIISLLLLMVNSACRVVNIRPSAWLQHYLPDLYQHLRHRLSIDNISVHQVLTVLLVNFGLIGYFLQLICYALSSHFVNPVLLMAPALFLSYLLSAALIHWFKQLNIHNQQVETTVDESLQLLGRIATVYKGNAKPGVSAEALVRDQYGKLHVVQVEPEYGELGEQSEVILFALLDNHYLAKLLPPDYSLDKTAKLVRYRQSD